MRTSPCTKILLPNEPCCAPADKLNWDGDLLLLHYLLTVLHQDLRCRLAVSA
jgi:hypothetical protein